MGVTAAQRDAMRHFAGNLFNIMCDTDWPENPNAWPEKEIDLAIEEFVEVVKGRYS
jgi:hypothetical protein